MKISFVKILEEKKRFTPFLVIGIKVLVFRYPGDEITH